MSNNRYAVCIYSMESKTYEVIETVLRYEALARLVLPGYIYVSPEDKLEVRESSDFDLSRLPKEYKSDDGQYVFIHNKVGMHLQIFVSQVEYAPHNLILRLLTEAVVKEWVSYQQLKQLLIEVSKAFGASNAIILDHDMSKYRTIEFVQWVASGFAHRSISWMRYFSEETVETIGKDKFSGGIPFAEVEKTPNGIFCSSTTEVFDANIRQHREVEEDLTELLFTKKGK